VPLWLAAMGVLFVLIEYVTALKARGSNYNDHGSASFERKRAVTDETTDAALPSSALETQNVSFQATARLVGVVALLLLFYFVLAPVLGFNIGVTVFTLLFSLLITKTKLFKAFG